MADMDASTVDRIIDRVADGEPLRRLLREENISPRVWYAVMESDGLLAERYARAKATAIEALAEETLDIADNGTNDWMERREDAGAGWSLNGEHVQRSRLRVDTRKWLLAKLAPKKYGDKVAHELGGQDGEPIKHVIETHIVDHRKPDQG